MLILVSCRGEAEFTFSLLRFTEKNQKSDALVEVVIFPRVNVPSYFGPVWQPRCFSTITERCRLDWKTLERKRFRLFSRCQLDPVRYIELGKCLSESASFTTSVVRRLIEASRSSKRIDVLQLIVSTRNQATVDFLWHQRIIRLVNNFIHLYETMAWLSTLGGAYSAMGDYGDRYAMVAKKISMKQLKLAMCWGDPTQVCRCWIFIAISAMQYGLLNYSKRLLVKQWQFAQSAQGERDPRLKNMILGTWERLRHERAQRKNSPQTLTAITSN